MINYFWVGIGGAVGSVLRFWLSGLIANTRFGEIFPFGTLVVNVTGSFVIGILAAYASPDGRMDPHWRITVTQLLMVGLCGGYTTFSSFSLQTLNMVRDHDWLFASMNVILSVGCCMGGVWLGYALGEIFNR
jgi:CrcB protein